MRGMIAAPATARRVDALWYDDDGFMINVVDIVTPTLLFAP